MLCPECGIVVAPGPMRVRELADVPHCCSQPAASMNRSDNEVARDQTEMRGRALARWDNEGGAKAPSANAARADAPEMSNAELVHLHVRIIALENLLLAVLAEGSDRQVAMAREMADCISPRPGSTQHPLTVQAAHHITDLVDRALHFRTVHPS